MYEEALKSKKLAEESKAVPGSGGSSLSGKGRGMVKAKGVAHSPRKKRQKMKRELPMRGQLFLWKKTKKM